MSSKHHQRVEELFHQIADESLSDRRLLLESTCGEDRRLANEVLALLEADIRGARILQYDLASLAGVLLDTHKEPVVPRRFGRYVIHEYLGEGGMGTVYLAERYGLGDQVAVKFLRDPWNSPSRQACFAREQRTLAGLSHRHIARLYDSGVADGTPWFAMEYVRGHAITEHCHRNGLGLRARLELFRAACEAVSYVHRNSIVHLDLKPSNVLVNADGEVKLVDFGIARHVPIEGREVERGCAKERLLSLNYAAPEQIRGEPADVQMDVHALGVLLYELLAGKVPVDVANASHSELVRILEEGPPPPSMSAREKQTPEIEASQAEWNDLDVLCLTAMHRDRADRYASVDTLMRNLNRFLRGEAVETQPARVGNRLGKFLRHNRRAVRQRSRSQRNPPKTRRAVQQHSWL